MAETNTKDDVNVLELPNELICEIGKYLDDESLLNISCTSNRMFSVLLYILNKRKLQCSSIVHLAYYNKIDLIENYYITRYDFDDEVDPFYYSIKVEDYLYEDSLPIPHNEVESKNDMDINYLYAICTANNYQDLLNYILENISVKSFRDCFGVPGEGGYYGDPLDIACRYRNTDIFKILKDYYINHHIFPPPEMYYICTYLDEVNTLEKIPSIPSECGLISFHNPILNKNENYDEINMEFIDLLIDFILNDIDNRTRIKLAENLIRIFLVNHIEIDICEHIFERLQILPEHVDETQAIDNILNFLNSNIVPYNIEFYITWLGLTKDKVVLYFSEITDTNYLDLFLD